MDYLTLANSPVLYLLMGALLAFISVMCVVFMVKSYRAGIKLGMDAGKLKRAMTSSVTFTVLPSISILLGVIALSGALGIPLAWMRLSVVGALQYELNVAAIAAESMGLGGLSAASMNMGAYTTIDFVMSAGIIGGAACCLLVLKKYLSAFGKKPKIVETDKPAKKGRGLAAIAMSAMFVGLCATYVASYIGTVINSGAYLAIATALVAAFVMAGFEYLVGKKGMAWVDNFSMATSMLIAMAAAVLINGLAS